jgi:DNA invertase Pin-like site-specific DNA recombinase
MAAIGYIRVSTEQQGESGAGLDAQRAAIVAFTTKAGLDLVAIHEDAGVSGAAGIEDRPGLIAAVSQLRKGDTLIVSKRCRLGREQMAVLMIEKAVAKRGASISSADGVGNGDDPSARFMAAIIDAAAAYERNMIRCRTRAALAAKRSKGERVGQVPFGWRDEDGRLVAVEAEQEVLTRIHECRANGLSLRAIAAILMDAGITTKEGKSTWYAATIKSILDRAAAVAA